MMDGERNLSVYFAAGLSHEFEKVFVLYKQATRQCLNHKELLRFIRVSRRDVSVALV